MDPDDEISGADAARIVATLELSTRFTARNVLARAENVRPSIDGSTAAATDCTVPWDDLEHSGPEAAASSPTRPSPRRS